MLFFLKILSKLLSIFTEIDINNILVKKITLVGSLNQETEWIKVLWTLRCGHYVFFRYHLDSNNFYNNLLGPELF